MILSIIACCLIFNTICEAETDSLDPLIITTVTLRNWEMSKPDDPECSVVKECRECVQFLPPSQQRSDLRIKITYMNNENKQQVYQEDIYTPEDATSVVVADDLQNPLYIRSNIDKPIQVRVTLLKDDPKAPTMFSAFANFTNIGGFIESGSNSINLNKSMISDCFSMEVVVNVAWMYDKKVVIPTLAPYQPRSSLNLTTNQSQSEAKGWAALFEGNEYLPHFLVTGALLILAIIAVLCISGLCSYLLLRESKRSRHTYRPVEEEANRENITKTDLYGDMLVDHDDDKDPSLYPIFYPKSQTLPCA